MADQGTHRSRSISELFSVVLAEEAIAVGGAYMGTFRRINTAHVSEEVPRFGSRDTVTTDDAAAWLRGDGDMIIAAMGRVVPIAVQIGVLAHADLGRLSALGRYCRRGSVRRTWGSDMAKLAGQLGRFAGSPEQLRSIQVAILVPLELDVLAGRRDFASRNDLIEYLYRHIPLSDVVV